MWYSSDYHGVLDLHQDAAEDYTGSDLNDYLGQTLLVSAQNLHDFYQQALYVYGEVLKDRHTMQFIYLKRGVDALFASFWLIRHHQYTAAYGRVRFLLETYLVVRELNRDKKDSARKMREKSDELEERDGDIGRTDPLTEYFDGRRRNLMSQFEKDYDWFDAVMGDLSDIGAHPQGIRSMWHDSRYSSALERDTLQFALVLAFGIAAQFIRLFEDTELDSTVHSELDPIFIQIMLVNPELPKFLEEDLRFSATK
jgi:hypothetical protein